MQGRGAKALVVGAGMGGLAAAAALSKHFDKVVVMDKDAVASAREPRIGVGQGGHAHLLLGAGAAALERVLPGARAGFDRAGAATLRISCDLDAFDFGGVAPQCDAGFSVQCLSRPRYEQALRDAVRALGNVDLRDEQPVERFLVEEGRCMGAELSDGGVAEADLVVDATGMNGPLAQRLTADGHADFETEAVKINVAYTSAKFERPGAFRGERRGFYVLPGAPNTAFAIMMPVEDDGWMVSLGTRGPSAVPRDLDGFLAFARALPTPWIHERLEGARPAGEFRTFRKTYATRRRFGAAARWPGRLIPVGDAMTSFNPTFGQGMTVAAIQAATLDAALASRASLDGLAADYFPGAEAAAGAAWSVAISTDYTYAETEGERPADFARSLAVNRILRAFAEQDEEFRIARQRVFHMLESAEVFRKGELGAHVGAFVQKAMAQPA